MGKKAVVIGSGFGGISAAIRLQAAGIETLLLEKRDRPGGRAYVYQDQGFTFDAGPTVVTAPQALHELFEIAGRKLEDYVELMPVAPFYRLCWEDGYKFDYDADMEHTLSQIQKKSPQDVEGYKKFFEYSKAVFQAGYADLVHVPFLNFWSMVKVAPDLVKLQAFRSVYSMVSKYIQDDQLRQAFSFHSLLVGGNPFTASSIYTLIHFLEKNWGVTFPRGGTGALVQGLVKLFTDLGGKIELSAEVDQVLTQRNQVHGVVLKNGKELKTDIVVSNADVVHTYSRLLKGNPVGQRRARRLRGKRHSMSLFLIYFGTKKKYPEMTQHSVLFGPRYKELLREIFGGPNLPDDFSLYLHAPTRTDPTLAPPGCETFYVLSPVPHLGKFPVDWNVEGPKYADKILAYLEKHYLPGLRQEIVTQRIFTPKDFETELNAHLGSAFSLEPTLLQSAYFRVSNRDPKIKGLYVVGAGTHPGAGIPGVVNSAKATVGTIFEDLAKVLSPENHPVFSPSMVGNKMEKGLDAR